MNLGDRLIEAMIAYSSVMNYETQTGEIAEPTTTPLGNGHTVHLYNSTQGRYFICTYMNTGWRMTEVL